MDATSPLRHVYPVMLDVTARLVVIVGGGAVAARKARGVMEAGATRIRCVALVFDEGLPDGVQRVVERYEPRHLDGAGLVFAATNAPEVNAAVVRDARARGVLVSRADADEQAPGDFVTPAILRRSAVTVAVSAGSPALAALIRDGLAGRWDDRWSRMADAMTIFRPKVLTAPRLTAAARRLVFRDLASEEALDVLAEGGIGALTDWLYRRHPDL